MPTQEERIAALEQTTREHRSVLQTLSYELTTIKGQITSQSEAIEELNEDLVTSFKQLADYHVETERQIDTRFNQMKEDLAAAKEDIKNDITAMENRILNAFQQLVTIINTQRPPSE